MVDKNTDFFKIVDNFAKTAQIPSISIIESKLDFVPKVTIAIPTYKRPDLLKEAVNSAIDQVDYDSYDILVVDNDPERNCDTENLMLLFHDPKISYFKNAENIQMASNWNRCFELARGQFVIMLHDDDLLLPTFISECMDIINHKSNAGIIKPMSYVFRGGGSPLLNFTLEQKKPLKLQRLYDYSNHNTFMLGAPSGCLFRKNDVVNLGGFNQEYFPIIDFCFIAMFSQKNVVYNFNRNLSFYRISANESLNLSTLVASFEGTYFIRKQIFLTHRIPLFIIKQYLSCSLTLSIKWYKKLNSDFEYDVKKLGLKNPTRLDLILFKITVRIINYILLFFTIEEVPDF